MDTRMPNSYERRALKVDYRERAETRVLLTRETKSNGSLGRYRRGIGSVFRSFIERPLLGIVPDRARTTYLGTYIDI